jgi:hypothetical protein
MIRKAWLAGLVLIAGCESAVESKVEQQQWAELGIRNYQYEFSVSCFCGFAGPNPARITVRNGLVTKVEPTDGGAAVSGSLAGWPTVDSLFAIVDRAKGGNPASLSVEYDETYHFPKSIHLDPVERVADDEVTYGAQKLVPSSSQ